MHKLAGATILSLIMVAAGCQTADQPASSPDTSAADLEAINQVQDAIVAAENAGDAAAGAAQYAEDAAYLPPDMPGLLGRAAIEARLQEEYSMMDIELSVTSRDMRVGGDIAYTVGVHTVRLTPKEGGDTMEASGKHVVTLARQADGSWKVTNLIFNTDAPMPPMPAGQ